MPFRQEILELNKVNPIKKILHLGAHLGNEIEFYQQLNPEVIYWFEANPELITDLEKNISKYPNIKQKVFNYAVSSETKKINFNLIYSNDMTNTGCSSILELKEHSKQYPHIKKIKTVEVDSVKIDEFLSSNNLITEFDYINMDIQGSEYDVLSTSELLFSKNLKLQIFQLETCQIEMYEGQKLESDIVEFMSSKGYEKKHYHAWAHNWGDCLFVKS
jgi:FkbM family methyltransferase